MNKPCSYCDDARSVMLNSEVSGPCPKCCRGWHAEAQALETEQQRRRGRLGELRKLRAEADFSVDNAKSSLKYVQQRAEEATAAEAEAVSHLALVQKRRDELDAWIAELEGG